jgi:hypothetical protein
MAKGLIILETGSFITSKDRKELTEILAPIFPKYRVALMEGAHAIGRATSRELKRERRRGIKLINSYFDYLKE